jgi:hypothetical protein
MLKYGSLPGIVDSLPGIVDSLTGIVGTKIFSVIIVVEIII